MSVIQNFIFLKNLEKAFGKDGVYVDDYQNRKLGRVGQPYPKEINNNKDVKDINSLEEFKGLKGVQLHEGGRRTHTYYSFNNGVRRYSIYPDQRADKNEHIYTICMGRTTSGKSVPKETFYKYLNEDFKKGLTKAKDHFNHRGMTGANSFFKELKKRGEL